jgi:acetylornithine deacetylase
MSNPFSARIEDGRLYGRGAQDMKGSRAACIGAAKMLVDARVRLRGSLVIAAVADEECGSMGTADLVGRCRVDGANVTETTNLAICLAHKGYIWIEVETEGKAAHGSRFRALTSRVEYRHERFQPLVAVDIAHECENERIGFLLNAL